LLSVVANVGSFVVQRHSANEPKARWCKRTSKNARRAKRRILAKAQQMRIELGLEPRPELEA
jgi:hypothetical protein